MTAAKLIEYRITRQLLQLREQADECVWGSCTDINPQASVQVWADRLIAILALTAGMLVVGSYLEELLWVVLAAATALSLRE
ncbi:MAG: hypothetical protein R3E64_10650 [Halioglobus sp.]